jgi:tetratricopeptide (TPR) repeat protein
MNLTQAGGWALWVLAGLVGTSACQPGASSPSPEDAVAVLVEGTGDYSRSISTESEAAQRFFDQGLRLAWGYAFPEAIASHLEALRHDPDHPMILWGLALAIGPNPNSRYARLPDDPQGEGRKAIERALARIDRASAAERALIEALSIRYDSDSRPNRADRDRAYLDAMRSLFEKYPDDPDVGSLLADAYMVTTPWGYWESDGSPRPGTEEAARALESTMNLHPGHPGANHLYIHLIEGSPTPERALPQADRLAGLMPNAGHLVHMPSHIYVRVGQHDKAIASNEQSVEADQRFLELWGDRPFPEIATYPLSAQNHGRHAYDFMRYAASVQGNYATALMAAKAALRHEPEASIRRGPGQRTVATVWLVHRMFGEWKALARETDVREGTPYLGGMWLYVRGGADLAKGDIASAAEAAAELQQALERSSPQTNSRFNPVPAVLRIASFGLVGEVKQAQGDLKGAIHAFREAVAAEDQLSYMEPPDWTPSMRLHLGMALLDAGRAEEAEAVFLRELEWHQENGWALYGLWRSLEAQGERQEVDQVRERFEHAWRGSRVPLPLVGSREQRQ